MSGLSIFFTILFYLSIAIFIIGTTVKVYKFWRVPAPLNIVLTPAPTTLIGMCLRMLGEVLLFRSLFKANKYIWFFSWVFHYGLVLVVIKHLGYFFSADISYIINTTNISMYGAYMTIFGLSGLLIRRIAIARIRYISAPSDYLMLILLILISAIGLTMSLNIIEVNIVMVQKFTHGLITLKLANMPNELIFIAHVFLAFLLLAIFPISKLIHAPGIFFSPTLNQIDNARNKRKGKSR